MNANDGRPVWIYSEEAKTRIAELGGKQITAFLDEVPLPDRKIAYRCIKSITGFRPGSERELKEKGKRIVSTLSQAPDANSKLHAAEWAAFSFAWLSWGRHKFQSHLPKPTHEPSVDEHVAISAFVRNLVPEHNLTVCREDVERLLLFSGFTLSDKSTIDLSWIPTRNALEQAKKAEKISAEVESLKQRLESRENEISEVRDSTNATRAEADNVQRRVTDSLAQISEIKSQFASLQSVHERAHLWDAEKVQSFENNIRQLQDELSALAEKLQSTFEQITEQITVLVPRIAASEESSSRLETAITALDERADHAPVPSVQGIVMSPIAAADKLPDVQFVPHAIAEQRQDFTVTLLADAKSALSVLTRNLSAIGVRKDDAVLAAASILTAVVAGQLVQFRGSFAELTVEAVAAALSDSPALFWRVPLGLRDSRETDYVLFQLSKDISSAGCIAIIGANKSAFEIYGDKLQSSVAKMQLGIRSSISNVPILATFVDGSGVLPPGSEFCCLGPVIDSDTLVWGRANKHATVTMGRISIPSWAELVEPAKTDEDTEQLIRSLPNFSFSCRLWERTSRNAILILRRLEKLMGTKHADNFLVHWLLPWARANGMTIDSLRGLLLKIESDWLDETVVDRALAEVSDANQ